MALFPLTKETAIIPCSTKLGVNVVVVTVPTLALFTYTPIDRVEEAADLIRRREAFKVVVDLHPDLTDG